MDSSIYVIVSTLVGNIIGFVLKNKTEFKNRLIPIVILVLALLKNTAVAAGLLPESASILHVPDTALADSTLSMAGFNWGFVLFVVNTILDAALPIGTHSMAKNLSQAAKK